MAKKKLSTIPYRKNTVGEWSPNRERVGHRGGVGEWFEKVFHS